MTIKERYKLAQNMRVIVNKIRSIVDNNKYNIDNYIDKIWLKYKDFNKMFNLIRDTEKYQQFLITKDIGFSSVPKQPVKPIDIKYHQDIDIKYDKQAIREQKALRKAFRSKTIDFGKRIRKASGQRHRVGGFAK